MTVLETDATPASPVVELEHTGPGPQRRVHVAFRMILVIPHWIWLSLVGFVAGLAIIGAWFGALFTGRVPEGLHSFIGRYLRYQTRVYAYAALLTDEYPPFDLDADDYAVELCLPPRDRLHRGAVFFRYFLVIPAMFVTAIAAYGIALCSLFIWLIVLVKGRMPRTIHDAITAVLRYGSRMYAYYALLTSEYPHRLYGDKPTPVVEPLVDEPLDLASAPPPTGAPVTEAPVERTTRLVLGKGAKRLLTLSMALVAVLFVGLVVVGVATSTQGDRAADRIEAQYDVLSADLRTFGTKLQSCGFEGGADCMNQADHDLASSLEDFRAELRDTSYPRVALGLAHQLEDDTDQLIDALRQRERATTLEEYQSISRDFVDVGTAFDQDYADLIATLRGSYE